MHTLLERSYSTRTVMKRTNFSRRYDKPDLIFPKKVYTHSQRSVHIRIQSYIITHIRTANALFFNTPINLPYLKMTVKLQNRLISNARLRLQLSYFLSTCQRKNCKILIPRQLLRLPQWIRTYPLSIFLNQRLAL